MRIVGSIATAATAVGGDVCEWSGCSFVSQFPTVAMWAEDSDDKSSRIVVGDIY